MGFMLKIVTPDREFFSEEVDRVIVRGVEGDLAVLKKQSTYCYTFSHWED